MNYDRIYEYRFQGIDPEKKKIAWTEIASFIYKKLGKPEVILDPAAGKCEFINSVPSKERWAIDLNEYFIKKYADPQLKIVVGDTLEVQLPQNYFEGIFISNFLEHLHTQEEVAHFLQRMYNALKPGGRIAIIGPNYKYTYREYFDFADHTVVLSDLGVAEHVYGVGFAIEHVYPQFLPLSFRGRIPVHKALIKLYLHWPFAWRFMGKQFLVIARKS